MTMKKLSLLLFASMLAFCSCNKDEDNLICNSKPLDNTGLMCDGGDIADVSLYCIKIGETWGEPWFEYYPKIKTVGSYSDIDLELYCNIADYIGRDKNNEEEYYGVQKLEMDYVLEKTSFLTDEYRKFRDKSETGWWPCFYSAYVNGTVAITCNKTLYGQQPGENLTHHFRVAQALGCLPVGRENPQILYNFGDRIPERMDSVFVDGAWMLRSYALNFIGEPQERYDELTLTLHFPLTKEHTYEYALWKYRGKDRPLRVTDEEFTSDCTIRFDWK